MLNRLLILLAFLFVFVFGLTVLTNTDVATTFAGTQIAAPEVVRVQPMSALKYPQDSPYNLSVPIHSRIGLETRLGNPQIPARGGDVWLQIGLRGQDLDNQVRQKIATNVTVTLIPAEGVRVVQIAASAGELPAHNVTFPLPELVNGDARVVLIQLRVPPSADGTRVLANVELRYTDLFTHRAEILTQSVAANFLANANPDPLVDIQVMHHVAHQRALDGIQELDHLSQSQKYLDAWNLAVQLEYQARRVAQLTGDARMLQDADAMRDYQNKLAHLVQKQNGFHPQYLPE